MASTSTSSPDLSTLLTPSLFTAVLEHCIPFPKTSPINFSSVAKYYWRSDRHPAHLRHLTWPALHALSTLGLAHVPDLLAYLPSPSAPTFPTQALGLQLLLDQASRTYFRATDNRYQVSYFDILALRLAYQFRALPRPLRPDAKERWIYDLGYSFDYWALCRFFFIAPVAHSPKLHDALLQMSMVEESRTAVEAHIGKRDPYRGAQEIALGKDSYAFAREIREGLPEGDGTTMEDYVFWWLKVVDVHLPIIVRFGRYPYYVAAGGEAVTEDEERYLEETGRFGELVKGEVAERIKKDVVAGRWTPLGEGVDYGDLGGDSGG